MKKYLLRSFLFAVAMVMGWTNALAQTTVYERGGSGTAWSESDLTTWGSAGSIDGGLVQKGTNGSFESVLPLTVEGTSVINLTATLTAGTAPGRSGSYDYITIGGFSLHLNGQDQKASVVIDGVETALSGFARNADYTVDVTIDQANGKISYTIGGKTSGTATDVTTATKVANVAVGHYKAGRENYEVTVNLKSIKVTETKQSVATANYTVKYVDESGTTLKENKTVKDVVVGNTPALTSEDKIAIYLNDKKYIYASDDAAQQTVASDNSTVVTVTFREAETWTAVLTNNLNSKTLEASGFEGDNVEIAYPTYQLVDGTLYSAGKLSSDGKGYYMTINLSEDGVTKNVVYEATEITNVKHLIEVEKVDGAAICGNGNTKIRSSFGGSGYAAGEDLKLTTLSPAKYKITAVVCDASSSNPSAVFNFKVADQVVFSTTPGAVNWAESTSEEFEVNQVSVLKLAADNGNTNRGIDFIYVTYEGEAENVIEAPHFKLVYPEEGTYDIMDEEIINSNDQALTDFKIEFPEGNVIKASETVKAQIKDANGNVLYEGTPEAETGDFANRGYIKMDGHITKAGVYTLVAPAGLYTLNGETLSDEQTFSFVIEGELPLGYYDNVAVIKNNMDYTVYTDPANESEVFMKYTAKYDGKVTITFDNFKGDMFAAAAEKNFYYDNKETAKLVPTETRSGMDYVYSEFEVEANKTYYIELMPTGSNGPIKFHVNFKLAAFDEIEDGPYFDVDSLLLEAKVRLMELDEMYNDETREKLGLTEAWSRINDLIAREELMIAADKKNHPNPSLAKLAGHYSRILNIEAAMSSFVVAAENVHPIDLFELYKEVIANINYTQDAIKNLIGDEPLIESLATLWNELLSRINKADDDILALQAKPNPTDDEIAALDEELNTLANDLEEFLALLNGEATGINAATATQNENAAVYNMAGQKVNTQFKGIVIKNGKKVIIK